MKLQVKKLTPVKKVETKENKTKSKAKKLPPDTYTNLIEPRELQITDNSKLVFNVSRAGEYGLPHLDIRLHVTSPQYTGMTKKGINFDCEFLYDFMEIINDINKELEAMNL